MLSQSCSAAFFGRHAASRINSLVVLPQELLQTILGGYRGGHATVAHVKALQLAKAYHRRTYGTSATSESYLNQVKPPFRILFAGADRFSCTSLELLAKQDKNLISELHVLVPPDKRTSRGLKELRRPRLRILAEALKLPILEVPEKGLRDLALPEVFCDNNSSTANHEEQHGHPSNLLITVSFDYLVPQSILKHFRPLNALNVHPSLLPSYKGAAPIQWSIINGVHETGVTVQALAKRFDEGHILAQERVPIQEEADYHVMEAILALKGAELLLDTLKSLSTRQERAVPQDSSKATLAHKLSSAEAEVDFSLQTAGDIVRRHRALSHQYPLWRKINNGKRVQLLSMSQYYGMSELNDLDCEELQPGIAFLDKRKEGVIVKCKDSTWLRVTNLKTEGRKALQAQPWWIGVARDKRNIRL